MKEVWKDLIYENISDIYCISNYGVIKNKYTNKIISQCNDKDGYKLVTLSSPSAKNKNKTLRVHRLVALTFIPLVHDKNIVNHKDGNRSNNVVTNLEWVNAKENTQDGIRRGTIKFHIKDKKYSPEFVKTICCLLIQGYTPTEIQHKLNLTKKERNFIYDLKRYDEYRKEDKKCFDLKNNRLNIDIKR